MATFSAHQGGTFTPTAHATNANNITLAADTAGDVGAMKMISWGGRGTTSTGYRTRWGRATTNGVTPAAITSGASNASVTSLCSANTYTTAPILAADPAALFAIDWNLVGGGGVIILPLGGEWYVVGTAAPYAMIACGNIAGADANLTSYGITWAE
jgi:hypothetical protein